MRYAIGVPDGLGAPGRRPLVLCLHPRWGDGRRRGFGRRALQALFEPALRDVHAILAAPDCPGGSWTDPLSEGAVLEFVDEIRARYGRADDRVFIAGLSDGATAVWSLLARHPERFRAGVAVSGSPRIEWAQVGKAPVYAIHGRGDSVMPLAPTRAAVATLRLRGLAAELVVVEDAAHEDTDQFIAPLRAAGLWLQSLDQSRRQN